MSCRVEPTGYPYSSNDIGFSLKTHRGVYTRKTSKEIKSCNR